MKVALVHDWITGMRGGERCLKAFLTLYPDADIFTLLHVPGSTCELIDQRVHRTSFLQNLPQASRFYRHCLPLYPAAISRFDFRGYDLVVSLSHAAAKNIRVPSGIPHVCYCFTPMRYIWDQARTYFGLATPFLWPVISGLRRWDRSGSAGVTNFVAISDFVAARIRCFYGRSSEVIYPPVEASWIEPAKPGSKGEAFLYAGALVPYKRVDLIVQAFNRTGEKLWIVGGGPELQNLKAIAQANIEFFGWVPDHELARFYRKSRALLFPAVEDFGIVPLEAMAAGRPVIGIYDGALRETMKGVRYWDDSRISCESASGVFFKNVSKLGHEAQLDSLVSAIYYFLEHEEEFQIDSCVNQAREFSPARFFASWRELIEQPILGSTQAQVYA